MKRRNKSIASATGLTLGVNWNQPITERLSYSILRQGFQYDFDANRGVFRDSLISDRNHEILDVDAFDVTEKVYSIPRSQTPFGNAFTQRSALREIDCSLRSKEEGIPKWNLGTRNSATSFWNAQPFFYE